MPTNEVEILRLSRNLARLQIERRKLRRNLKVNAEALRLNRKHLRALIGLMTAEGPDLIPSRTFGEGVGHLSGLKTGTDK